MVVWQLKGMGQDRERRAMRLIGAGFGLLAVYIVAQLVVSLSAGVRPLPSPLGLAWLAITGAAMAALAWGKRVTGRALGNALLTAEAGVTLIDAGLALAVLVGVGLNAAFGWWWADPISGLIVFGYAVKEGRAAWRHGAPIGAGP